jgi:uncharacterized cofD-like protein
MRILLATGSAPLETLIRRSLMRFSYHWETADNGLDAFQKAITQKFDLLILDITLPRMNALEILRRFRSLENFKTPPVIVLTASEEDRLQVEAEHFPRTEVVPQPMVIRKFVTVVQQILEQEMRIACVGGGTGLFTLLLGLKTLSGIQLSSIVSMSDDGGSTGRLRDIFGILPPGDVRRSLIALSTAPDLLNELMQHRFKGGGAGFEGHNLGNLLLTALSEMRGSMTQAVKSLGDILNIQGHVIPVTETINTLHAELQDGKVISGEHRIGLFEGSDPALKITRLWQEPPAQACPDALEAVLNAKFVILGPGDLFTSIIPNLIVNGMAEAVAASQARKIYICNVMTKPGETTNFQVSDHVRELLKYLKKDCLDIVLCSSTRFSPDAEARYREKSQAPVVEHNPLVLQGMTKAKILWADIASETELVRHDSLKLAAELKKIFESWKNAEMKAG